MQSYWKRIIDRLTNLGCVSEMGLNGPVDEKLFSNLEEHIGVQLPQSVKEFLSIHNGQSESVYAGLIYGELLLSIDDIKRCWDDWRGIDEEEMNDDCAEFMASEPAGFIKPVYTNKKWIPLTHDVSGNHIGIDYDPDDKGAVGQIIKFGRDEDTKVLLADNFESFIEKFVKKLDSAIWKEEYLEIPA
jgi:cell wall assembly regulator SMI1